jgi:hypothetical protein
VEDSDAVDHEGGENAGPNGFAQYIGAEASRGSPYATGFYSSPLNKKISSVPLTEVISSLNFWTFL